MQMLQHDKNIQLDTSTSTNVCDNVGLKANCWHLQESNIGFGLRVQEYFNVGHDNFMTSKFFTDSQYIKQVGWLFSMKHSA